MTFLESPPTSAASPQDDAAARASEQVVTFAGALPPPVSGMTAMTEVIVNALRERGTVHCINWSRGRVLRGWKWRAARGWGAIRTLAELLRRGKATNGTFYYPMSRGVGLNYDLPIVALARRRGYRVVLHHHSYSYIDRYDWRAARLARLAHVHAVHCELMREHFLAQYDCDAEFWIVPPTIVSQQMTPLPRTPRTSFVAGFFSTILMKKGIDEAIATFERVAAAGRDVRMIVAGPCKGSAERQLIDAAVARWPDRMEYRGPVYGAAKAQYFADIDVLLFPTRYPAESWGIVLTEALQASCPVMTRSRGCIPWIVDAECGLAVDPDQDFITPAAELIGRWMDSPPAFAAAQAAARRRSQELEADADRELPEFINRFFAESPTSR